MFKLAATGLGVSAATGLGVGVGVTIALELAGTAVTLDTLATTGVWFCWTGRGAGVVRDAIGNALLAG